MKYAIGIDIGGTNTDIGIVDREGNCMGTDRISTSAHDEITLYADLLVESVRRLILTHGVDDISGIGVGVPNGNFYTGCIDNAVNLNFKGKVNLRELIQDRIDLPVVITNDANAAAYGEMIYGGAKEMKHFIMITLGTGVGSGIVVDGKLLYGHDGYAGELGHTIMIPGGRPCNCGRNGCLEQYASAGGIKKSYITLMKEKWGEHHRIAEEDVNSVDIVEMAEKGDPIALRTFEMTGEVLGLALANAVTYTSPKAIFLMGGPVKAGKILLDPLCRSFDKNLLFIYRDKVKIIPSHLNENEAAILGAAALTW